MITRYEIHKGNKWVKTVMSYKKAVMVAFELQKKTKKTVTIKTWEGL